MAEHDTHDRERQIAVLQEQVEQLTEAVTSHAVVHQAIGVVIAYGGVPPETAWDVLEEVSQHTDIDLPDVATRLVQWPRSAQPPPQIHGVLDSALKRRASPESGTRSSAEGSLGP
ncbi:ANTAR domain-containing protein [Streptomyces sp. NPDC048514]|uniref:ANTAR domain-containing protein n=1 Tax=Streptomyces sp. NPDC048514 TaxID=3365564 RepID=UPI0037217B93